MDNQSHASALEFISKWDYEKASTSDKYEFEKGVKELRDSWEEADLKAALKHLQTVVCASNVSVSGEGPAVDLIYVALHCILEKIDDHEKFQEEYAEFCLACIAAGPCLTQITVMDKILNEGLTNNYIQELTGDKLTAFLEGLKKEFICTGSSPEEYYREMSSVLNSKIIKSFKEDQCQDNRVGFVKLFMFYQGKIPESDEHMAKLYYDLVSSIESLLGREPWQELEAVAPDPAPFCFREQMQTFAYVINAGRYPAYGNQVEIFESILQKILEPIRKNKTYFNIFLDDIIQLFCTLAKLSHNEAQEKLMKPFSSFFYNLEDPGDLVQKKPEIFMKYAPVLENLVLEIPHSDCMGMLINSLVERFLMVASGSDPGHVNQWIRVLAAFLTQPDVRYVNLCKEVLTKHKMMFNWEDHVDDAGLLLNSLGRVTLEKPKGESKETYLDPDDVGQAQEEFVDELLNQLKFDKLLGHIQKYILSLVEKILSEGNEYKFGVAYKCTEFIQLKGDLNLALPLMKILEKQFEREDFPWHRSKTRGICIQTLYAVIRSYRNQTEFAPYAARETKSGENTEFVNGLFSTILLFGVRSRSTKNHDDFKPLVGELLGLLQCDEEMIRESAGYAIRFLSESNPSTIAPHLNEVVQVSLANGGEGDLLSIAEAAYKVNPQPVDDEFDTIFNRLSSVNNSDAFRLLKEMAEQSPKLFTKEYVDRLLDQYLDNPLTEAHVLQILQALANSSPAVVQPHIDLLFTHMNSMFGAVTVPYIYLSIVKENKDLTISVFGRLVEFMENHIKQDYNYLIGCLNVVRVMGMEDREILKPKKKLFENIGKKHHHLKDLCKVIIDIINEKSFDDITGKVEQHEEDIDVLETRVTSNENEVKEIGQEVETQGKQVGQLKKDVAKQEERIDDLEEVVDDTVEKVEEVDKKTLSNAPAWSRDVSILLNPEAEHDWRLLAQRLGYTPEDIRGWATQHDPCMSLLSEWFATHKTSEATKAVLKTLEEMNRLDAAEIVGRAMQAVENVIQDESPDYETPPPIFISYQWAHQPEVRLLRKHLEMAGFESWMDIGQMGGGDKLYAKIDQGIRAAKVVICCVTNKYARSPNCNREVNLAVNLGKPIIPLLLENVAWPPPGAMGPIFGEYLYIRFFQRGPKEDTKDGGIWPPMSFQELLMQLSYMKLIPEQSRIEKPYENWWLPPEEVIVVKKKTYGAVKNEAVIQSKEKEGDESQPEVFISYQWGIQPQVKALYKRMSSLGYHCWMDIHQMGGGDSLYDKIDRGVRGCKVVLSCVTEKYSKSANCRREVSLSDALKKPIIPLLLEDTTWPPSGPMSMVFTQLLYIDFKDEEVQTFWSGPTFDQLRGKLETYLPDYNTVEGSEGRGCEPTKAQPKREPPIPMLQQEPEQGACSTKLTLPGSSSTQAQLASSQPPESIPEYGHTKPPSGSDSPRRKNCPKSCLIQ